MDALLVILIALVAVVAIAGLVVVLLARNAAKKQAAKLHYEANRPRDPLAEADADALRGDPRKIKAGDMIDVKGEGYAVRGTLRLTEGSYTWTENLLDTGTGKRRWLSVEEDPALELVLWAELDGGHGLQPGAREIHFDGRVFRSKEHGRASFAGEGTTGLHPTGWMRYHDYTAPDGVRLSFEDFGESGKWEAALGQVIGRYDVNIFAA
ncbi:DUF4178 domain-containing protein [Actinorhabdospora filicis]|uniref:DUF4178 domain-containing protein n=1 Tax=Actinorhabdospora filicis TaxID=1785913 RepID=UPI0025563466|nr:DUF4178 domain-containing protein [Actinorhabdospora filicis]